MRSHPASADYARHLSLIGAALDARITHPTGDPLPRRSTWGPALDVALPRRGLGPDAVLDEVVAHLIPNGMRAVDPEWSGWILSAAESSVLAATAAAAVTGPQRYLLTAYNLVEEVSLRWLAQVCGLDPERMKGIYSSGGSVANIVALGAARQWSYEQRGVDVAADGMAAAGRPGAIYASSETHHTVLRAAAVLGLGRSAVREIPVDHRQRMDVAALAERLTADRAADVVPIAVVANAGTTNTGAIDPIRAIGELAHEHGAWFHVDGAYGLVAWADERVRPLLDGLDLADSAIVDPHKWLSAPTGIGATFVRDPTILERAFTQEPAAYLAAIDAPDDVQVSVESMGIHYGDMGVELSAPARGTAVWATLLALGGEGVAARVREDRDLAAYLSRLAHEHPRLEVLAEPTLSITCFRYAVPATSPSDADALTEAIYHRLVRTTPYVPSTTRVAGALAIRPCFTNPRTDVEHVAGLADAVARIGDELTGR